MVDADQIAQFASDNVEWEVMMHFRIRSKTRLVLGGVFVIQEQYNVNVRDTTRFMTDELVCCCWPRRGYHVFNQRSMAGD